MTKYNIESAVTEAMKLVIDTLFDEIFLYYYNNNISH